jgi:hypothetical protein
MQMPTSHSAAWQNRPDDALNTVSWILSDLEHPDSRQAEYTTFHLRFQISDPTTCIIMQWTVNTNFPHRHFPFPLTDIFPVNTSFPLAYITTELSVTLPSALLLYILSCRGPPSRRPRLVRLQWC